MILITTQKVGNELNVVVKDNGIGMEEEVLGKIFDRFYQVDNGNQDSITSTGIGLSLVKEIVDAHHGEYQSKAKKEWEVNLW